MTMHLNPEIRRQAILHYLEFHGTSTAKNINESVGISRSALNVLLRSMTDDGEVSVQQRSVHKGGSNYYTAIGDTPAEDFKPAAPRANLEPWYTIHRGADGAHPIPNQGGQGNVRARVWAGSSM